MTTITDTMISISNIAILMMTTLGVVIDDIGIVSSDIDGVSEDIDGISEDIDGVSEFEVLVGLTATASPDTCTENEKL